MADLKPVCKAEAVEGAKTALDELEKKWGEKYPIAIKSWREIVARKMAQSVGLFQVSGRHPAGDLHDQHDRGCASPVAQTDQNQGRVSE